MGQPRPSKLYVLSTCKNCTCSARAHDDAADSQTSRKHVEGSLFCNHQGSCAPGLDMLFSSNEATHGRIFVLSYLLACLRV